MVQQDSEVGLLKTRTAYLSGFKRQTTNPNGGVTVESFQAFGQPSFDAPILIGHARKPRAVIDRDVFDKPTAITREASN